MKKNVEVKITKGDTTPKTVEVKVTKGESWPEGN